MKHVGAAKREKERDYVGLNTQPALLASCLVVVCALFIGAVMLRAMKESRLEICTRIKWCSSVENEFATKLSKMFFGPNKNVVIPSPPIKIQPQFLIQGCLHILGSDCQRPSENNLFGTQYKWDIYSGFHFGIPKIRIQKVLGDRSIERLIVDVLNHAFCRSAPGIFPSQEYAEVNDLFCLRMEHASELVRSDIYKRSLNRPTVVDLLVRNLENKIGENGYKDSSDGSNKVGIIISFIDSPVKFFRNYGAQFTGVFLCMCACCFIVLALVAMTPFGVLAGYLVDLF